MCASLEFILTLVRILGNYTTNRAFQFGAILKLQMPNSRNCSRLAGPRLSLVTKYSTNRQIMRNQPIFFAILILALNFTAQHSLGQTFIKDKSAVTFKIKNAGFWVNGSFSDFDMQAQVNPASLGTSQLSGSLTVSSISTNNNKRDEHLLSEDYFEAEKFPTITLTSSQLSKAGDGYVWQGTLKIKETEKTVSIPFQIEEKGDHLLLLGEFTINRIDYGVGKKSWLMNQKVFITLQCAVPKTF